MQCHATGSGEGILQLEAGEIDFAASDIPLTDEQMAKFGVRDLKFTREALAGIFSGTVTSWNDPPLAKANLGAKLPPREIAVVHRGDASGSTYVFTDFLSKVSEQWKTHFGHGTS